VYDETVSSSLFSLQKYFFIQIIVLLNLSSTVWVQRFVFMLLYISRDIKFIYLVLLTFIKQFSLLVCMELYFFFTHTHVLYMRILYKYSARNVIHSIMFTLLSWQYGMLKNKFVYFAFRCRLKPIVFCVMPPFLSVKIFSRIIKWQSSRFKRDDFFITPRQFCCFHQSI